MAEDLVLNVIAKLTRLIPQKPRLRGLEKDLSDINSRVYTIHTALHDHDITGWRTTLAYHEWRAKVECALGDTDLLLDEIDNKCQPKALWKRNKLRENEHRVFRYRRSAAVRLEIGPKIKGVKARLSSLVNEAEDLGLIKREHPEETPILAMRGFKKDLFDINSSVSAIKDVLPIAEKRSVRSKPVKDWLKKADDAPCDVDKLLNIIRTEQKIALWSRKIKAILSSIQNEAKKLGLVKRHRPKETPINTEESQNSADHCMEGGSSRKIKILLTVNFGLELLSAFFDQFSSEAKPEFALAALVTALFGFLVCTAELAYKGKKEKARLRWHKGIPWFYCPADTPTTYRRLGNFAEIFGLGSAILQSFTAIVTCAFYSHHSDNPIKMNLFPVLFGFCVMLSRFLKDRCPKVSVLQADENV